MNHAVLIVPVVTLLGTMTKLNPSCVNPRRLNVASNAHFSALLDYFPAVIVPLQAVFD
jgi:hypothetical protein